MLVVPSLPLFTIATQSSHPEYLGLCVSSALPPTVHYRTKDTMEDFLKQMVAIEQSRVDKEDKRLGKEAIAGKQDKAQMAEQRETDKRMMAEQHD